MKLDGKRALVTGSDQGIGRAIALRFAEDGADVAINYRLNGDLAGETCRQIERLGRRTVAIQADVSVVADAQRLVADAIAALGGLDILVNNAGIERNAAFVGRHGTGLPRRDRGEHDGPVFQHPGVCATSRKGRTRRQRHQHQLRT